MFFFLKFFFFFLNWLKVRAIWEELGMFKVGVLWSNQCWDEIDVKLRRGAREKKLNCADVLTSADRIQELVLIIFFQYFFIEVLLKVQFSLYHGALLDFTIANSLYLIRFRPNS